MKMDDWIFFFAHAFRFEAGRMHPEEVRFVRDYLDEVTLTKPCQVEVLKFRNPYRLFLLFLLDKTKPDLRIRSRNAEWSDIEEVVASLRRKYAFLETKTSELIRMLMQGKESQERNMYGIDFCRNLCVMDYFNFFN
jgi:hypothetical protein